MDVTSGNFDAQYENVRDILATAQGGADSRPMSRSPPALACNCNWQLQLQ